MKLRPKHVHLGSFRQIYSIQKKVLGKGFTFLDNKVC